MTDHLEKATFAAGCFWGVEKKFRALQGVVDAQVGYCDGQTAEPTYKEVCSDTTGHAEAIELVFDPTVISYAELVEVFYEIHDPTTLNRQGPDVGSQYRSAIFTHNAAQADTAKQVTEVVQKKGRFVSPIVTQIKDATPFYRAEEYHQQYLRKNGY